MAKEDSKEKKNTKNSKNAKAKSKAKKKKKTGYETTIKKELKLVKWPTKKEIVKYTIATIIVCLIIVAFFGILEFVMAYVKGMFN